MNLSKILKIAFVGLLLMIIVEIGYYIYIQFNIKKIHGNIKNEILQPNEIISEKKGDFYKEDIYTYLSKKYKVEFSDINIQKITVEELKKIIKNTPHYIFIDVREKNEYDVLYFKSGINHINIRLGDLLNNNLNYELIKNKKIFIIAFTNNRAEIATKFLVGRGIKNIYMVEGGFNELGNSDIVEKIPLVMLIQNSFPNLNQVPNLSSFSIKILDFGPKNENKLNLYLITTQEVENIINDLSKKNVFFIIKCKDDVFCYQASSFWYLAKNKISIIGILRK